MRCLGQCEILILTNLNHPTCILPGHLLGILDDLVPYLGKVVKLLSRQMQEFSPLILVVLVELGFGVT